MENIQNEIISFSVIILAVLLLALLSKKTEDKLKDKK
jgi:hypothetical protein